jgi:hypothetical protein
LKSNKPPSDSVAAVAASCANKNIRFVIIIYFL